MESVSPYPRCTVAADFFARLIEGFVDAEPLAAQLAGRLSAAGVDPLALVDHWILPGSPDLVGDLTQWGFQEETIDGDRAWFHPLARLPRVRLSATVEGPVPAFVVEDVTLFLEKNALAASFQAGDRDSAYETAEVRLGRNRFHVVARQGYRGFKPAALDAAARAAIAKVRSLFADRDRSGEESDVVKEAVRLYTQAAALVGAGRAVDEFFLAERVYYVARNAAARWQYEQQQAVGIGWANHDHHTYRSSRAGFQSLMQLWQAMGFTFRERFYAGADAGWGAQVAEHPISRVVLFCDVDIAPEELDIDFAAIPLPARAELGTIGLWCALHTSSIAAAGLHHLECEFDYAQAEENFQAAGFGVMKPFTDLPILKQAFTEPELWKVAPERLKPLVAAGAITAAQAETFATKGAAGSHLEILQRWEGFKGFNKTGVSSIILETDARRAAGVA